MQHEIANILNQYSGKYHFIQKIEEQIMVAFELIIRSYHMGGKLLVCGNGGSNADADHIVGELLKGFLMKRPVDSDLQEKLKGYGEEGTVLAEKLQGSLPAINLGAHNSLMTAVLNDIGGTEIFAQQVMGYGKAEDILIGISTSGNSQDVINAGIVAKAKNLKTIGLTGNKEGKMDHVFDVIIHAPSAVTAEVQEMHSVIYHLLCAMVEAEFWDE